MGRIKKTGLNYNTDNLDTETNVKTVTNKVKVVYEKVEPLDKPVAKIVSNKIK